MPNSSDALRLFGITLIGATPENLRKLLLTLTLIVVVALLTWLLRSILRMFMGTRVGHESTSGHGKQSAC